LVVGDGESEATAALARLSQVRSGRLSTPRVDLRLGTEASSAVLAGDLRGYEVLHLAAHGFVDREFPQFTGIGLARRGEGDHGMFTIGDALELDLDANLVVLSACQTARGEVKQGEGVQSLARAFLYAGARGVVASLWDTHDEAAAQTMEEFYRGAMRRGLPPGRALREAKLSVRRGAELRPVGESRGSDSLESGHPFFWAPFIYIGLPR
ncbi:MAG TPA: CHAT domain-containing protein, partial [Planctomycetota bacterium]|nr:CHAT domain-containing protein [Planctomycetota bacterium]